ncbi:MAG TPA: GDP-mannose 4,6-dehydratase [Negativicutes bacterium]|nr:GDP-mannose 4,6-dehydratase [Negativicutes bacterium]
MKRIIIVGCNGQDGTILYDQLTNKGHAVIGIGRELVKTTGSAPIVSTTIDIGNSPQISSLVAEFQPHEIYYLAAFHHSAEDQVIDEGELFLKSSQINVNYLIHFLEAIRQHSRQTRIFYAASSHIFGAGDGNLQDETTPISPVCAYGITKSAGLLACRYYREKHSLFATTGILYNHESRYRSKNFVSQKIIQGAVAIKNDRADKMMLGDLSAEIDWGYAPDYVEAMQCLLEIESPGEFIIATGKSYTVRDFVKIAFSLLDLDWEKYVYEDKKIISKPSIIRRGNPQKLMMATGWNPKTSFPRMIEELLRDEGAFNCSKPNL